jgi:nucleoside-diphosphate-sugar epimerase
MGFSQNAQLCVICTKIRKMPDRSRILILGGLGFIGKNLFLSLVKEGYTVSILTDSWDKDDPFITPEVRSCIQSGSILDQHFIEEAVQGYDVIYSLAGRSGASDSIADPYLDLDRNLKGHLNILEACRKHNPNALLVFPSSRLVYGKPAYNPVDEGHPLHPESIYAIHKITTEHYYLLYKKLYGINSVIFRISNPYGPYQRFGSNHYGILNWFIHKAVTGEPIEIYGNGEQMRDFIYIDDIVSLLKLAITNQKLWGRLYNVGYGKGISLQHAALLIRKFIPGTQINFKPWPEIDEKIETGNYISNISLLKEEIGWSPLVEAEAGILKTIKFYERTA